MKTIKGDLILTEDTTFDESIKVEGDIKGYYNLKVVGNIDARNINAVDINAGNINALDIICETRTKKTKTSKTKCRVYIKNKSKTEYKEQEE